MNEPTTAAPRSRGVLAIDVLVLSALLVIGLLGFQPLFGGIRYLISGLVALALTLVIALIGARFSWGPTRTALCLILIYVVLGTPLAAPDKALWKGIVPSLASLLELLKAPVTSWRTALTMAAPVGTVSGVLAVVWITMLVLPQLAFAVLLRTRRHVVAWLFPIALLLITIVMGTSEPYRPLVRGIVAGVITLAWFSWHQERERLVGDTSTIIGHGARPGSLRNPVLRRRLIGALMVLALAGGAAVWAAPRLEPREGTQRVALRDGVVPPPELHDYVSPLAQYRGYVTDGRDAVYMSVRGAEPGDVLRLATMDSYDRQVFKVAGGDDAASASGAFLRTSVDVDLGSGGRPTQKAEITIGKYAGPWVPSLGEAVTRIDPRGGRSASLAGNLYVNRSSQTVLDPAGIRAGDRYTMTYVPYRAPTPQEQAGLRFGEVDLPEIPSTDPRVRSTAEDLLGQDRSDFVRMQRLTDAVALRAVRSHGTEGEPASLPGHGERRLLSMLTDFDLDRDDLSTPSASLVGDDEQFAALVAVLARSAGVPARVGVGFTVPDGSGSIDITGKDASAWVEAYFEGYGWVRFDPSPGATRGADLPGTGMPAQAQPATGTPPEEAAAAGKTPPELEGTRVLPEVQDSGHAWRLAALWVGIPLLLWGLLLLAIVVIKAVRRLRRRENGSASDRVAGGWREVMDHARDLGAPLPARGTRRDATRHIAEQFPGADVRGLAHMADRGVFAPEEFTAAGVQEYWREVARARRSMSAAAPWHLRVGAVFSTRSLRGHRRSRRGQP